ncbi:MAG: ATP-binding protein [Bacteroidales bacterium]|nr:ATP-binding protein [Bacteroidales bacterium]MBQ9596853.1 ATP-binding protein [Bacteroidales bacterium]
MEIPFAYGKIVADNDFTDREEETRKLVSNFLSQTNTAIISPRRWGKSSLVNKAVATVSKSDKSVLFMKMNAFRCETPLDFYELFAKRTIECISSTAETLLSNAKEFISRLLPKLSISDPSGQYEMSFGVDLKNNPIGEDILDLPQQIATARKKKVVVCIDEFQQTGEFAQTERFQKILRSHWEEQPDVAYVLYGSKKHMMLNIFGEYGSPFYKFGDLMFLPKISRENWITYIQNRFAETKKSISSEIAGHLADLVESHSYYVQQLAQYAWLRTDKVCTEDIVEAAFQGLLDSLNLQFVNLMDSLTEKQRSFLCAVSDGIRNLSSVDTLSRYKLGTSGNIRILKGALKKRDLIEETARQVEIQDPVFNQWIQRVYKSL